MWRCLLAIERSVLERKSRGSGQCRERARVATVVSGSCKDGTNCALGSNREVLASITTRDRVSPTRRGPATSCVPFTLCVAWSWRHTFTPPGRTETDSFYFACFLSQDLSACLLDLTRDGNFLVHQAGFHAQPHHKTKTCCCCLNRRLFFFQG